MPEGHDSPNPKKKSRSKKIMTAVLILVIPGVIYGVLAAGLGISGPDSVVMDEERKRLLHQSMSASNKIDSSKYSLYGLDCEVSGGYVLFKSYLKNTDSANHEFEVMFYLADDSDEIIDFTHHWTGDYRPNGVYLIEDVIDDHPDFHRCGASVTAIDPFG